MKTLITTFSISLFLAAVCFAQDKNKNEGKLNIEGTEFKFEFEKECGSPFTESNIFDHRKGKVVAINSANEITFEQNSVNGNRSKGRFIVKLAGVDADNSKYSESAKELKNFLIKSILGKKIQVIGNTDVYGDRSFYGILRGGESGEVNRDILEKGMAEFRNPPYPSVWGYNLCVYRQMTEKAKKAKLGIWAQ